MGKLKITFISDTHTKHNQITKNLPGGDILIHAGDMSSMGYKHEIENFCKWFDGLDNYDNKVFIAGNHDWGFQNHPEQTKEIIEFYKNITYLEDQLDMIGQTHEDMLKIWGSPITPRFHGDRWAFNKRRGFDIAEVWDQIPVDTDVIVTHGPSAGKLDFTTYDKLYVGCENLRYKIKALKPKLHIFGHIHEGYGMDYDDDTTYYNASICTLGYEPDNKPFTIEV